MAVPPKEGDDFNDVLVEMGEDAVRQIIGQATASSMPSSAGEPAHNLPLGFIRPAGKLPLMRSDEGDLSVASAQSWELLLRSNQPPWLFRRAAQPTWVVYDDDGMPMTVSMTEQRLRYMLAQLAEWVRMTKDGLVAAHPPAAVVKSLLATPNPNLPVLTRIATTPVFGRTGQLLTVQGYHPDAKLLYHPAPGFAVALVPERPTSEQIASSKSLIADEMLGEFPFTSKAEKAHAVAMLLLGFLRSMIGGPTPLHLIEKPSPGTGATLMVDAIATVLTGVGVSVMTEGSSEEEWRKRLTSQLRRSPFLIAIDNLRQPLNSSALAAALTAPFWEDRILGVSEIVRLPIHTVWVATGNNPVLSNEMARRVVRIRLDAGVDQPWRREGFRHPDLIGWVQHHRAQLVHAGLVLCQAWIAEGRPSGGRRIGSYENWSHAIGGVLGVVGIEGFLANQDEVLAAVDGEAAEWRSFVSAWWARFGQVEVGTKELFDVAQQLEGLTTLGTGNEHSQRTRLGKALGKMRDRVFDIGDVKLRVCVAGLSHQANRWRLSVQGEGSAGQGNVGGSTLPGLSS